MRVSFLLTVTALFSLSATAQQQRPMVLEPNIILQPAPYTPLSNWTDGEGRKAVSFTLPDGVTLRGFRYASAVPNAPEILFFNGLGVTVVRGDRAYRAIESTGANVTVYDYRGWGLSDGPADIMTSRADSVAAYDALKLTANGRPVLVYGASLGTTMAAYVASERAISALVLGMPIASAEAELPAFGQMIGVPPAMLAGVAPSANFQTLLGETALVAKSTSPLLVMGSPVDTVVPYAQNRAVFEASASTEKRFVDVPGVSHGQVILAPEALAALKMLLGQVK